MSVMALEAVKLHFFFAFAFIYFLPLFTIENERGAVGFSTSNVENKQFPYSQSS
jgi:hypothetical protein